MDSREFYNYIMENFNLDGTASRLVKNAIEYVNAQEFVDEEDAQAHLKSLLDGAFGIEEHEIKLYRALECERCGEYASFGLEVYNGFGLCARCATAWDSTDEPWDSFMGDSEAFQKYLCEIDI